MQLSQNVDLFQDLDLEIVDDLRGHLWALLRVSNTSSVVVNWQNLVDVCRNLIRSIAFQSWHSDFVKDWALEAFLCCWPEERIVLEHIADQYDHVW